MKSQQTTSTRTDFLLNPDVVFLNHGSFGATPRPVFESYQRWQRELELQPVEFLGRRAPELMAHSRAVLADYLGTTANNLVYVPNATTGLNIVARSLQLGQEDEVLTSQHEYGALDRTWRFLSSKRGFKYTQVPISIPVTTANDFVEQFWQGVSPSTRVIFLSHITSPTALIFPIKEICRRARKAGILTVIDGAHGPGQIPIDLDAIGADIYSGNLHKWLCAPKGSAFLFARPEVQHLIEPLVVSWGWESDAPSSSRFVDEQEWVGTRDLAPFLAVPDAICYQQEHSWERVQRDCHALVGDAQQRICALTGLEPLHSGERWYAQMAAAPLPASTDLFKLKQALYEQFRVEIPLISWNSYKLVRISIQAYNTVADVDVLEKALKTLL